METQHDIDVFNAKLTYLDSLRNIASNLNYVSTFTGSGKNTLSSESIEKANESIPKLIDELNKMIYD